MTLTLQIENFHMLDDGGPVSVEVPPAGISVGRGAGMGWVLPDVSRHISGHHFDVGFDGTYWWLRDVSTNGTYLQGQRHRLDGPHQLNHGDRFQVGQYVIVAFLNQPADLSEAAGMSPASLPQYSTVGGMGSMGDDPWAVGGPVSHDPINPMPQTDAWRGPDFSQEFIIAPTGPASVQTTDMPPHHAPAGALQGGAGVTSAPPPEGAPPPDGQPVVAPPANAFIRAFCKGAGLPPDLFSDVAAEDLARNLGEALRHVSREVMLSLQDRAVAKQFALAGDRTMRSATDNNPLKFLPDPEQAIEAMFLRPRAGFQQGPAGLDDALKDLRLHQAAVFAALQPTLAKLLGDLSPESIEAEVNAANALLGSGRRARAWEVYVKRWDSKAAGHDNGILDEFLEHFAVAYRDVVARAQSGAMPAEKPPAAQKPVLRSLPGGMQAERQDETDGPDHAGE